MPRQARLKGEFSVYHIIQRGNEKKNLFLSGDDMLRFLETLQRMKGKYNFLLYAYCLMDNHVHLLIDDNGNDISVLVKSINVSYAHYFNRTHQRCGHLFQDRFKSELVDKDPYLLEVSRYIHNNPVKAGIVKEPSDYRWSSYNIYAGRAKDTGGLIDKGRILSIFSDNRVRAVRGYIGFVNSAVENKVSVMDVEEPAGEDNYNSSYIGNVEEARTKIKEFLKQRKLSSGDLKSNLSVRNELIKEIRRNSSLTLKQIGELCGGVSESRVSRILAQVDG